MNIIRTILLFTIFIVNLNSSYSGEAEQLPPGAEEGGFITSYSNFRINIPTYIYQDSVYMPLTQTLSFLKIYFIAETGLKNINGFFISQDTSFEINFIENIASIKDREINFSAIDYFRTELDVFVTPSFFEKIFNFYPKVYYNELAISINSKTELPISKEAKREKKYSYLEKETLIDKVFPLIYGRDWSLLNGGVFNYSLGNTQSPEMNNTYYYANLGIQFLGGDMQIHSNGNFEYTSKSNVENKWLWRYDFDSKYVSNVTLGQVTPMRFRSTGFNNINLPYARYDGIQVSNEVTKMNYFFSSYIIEDKLEPDWQVELYKNGHLVDQQRTDALGYYRFTLPISYGNNNITLKFYGPNGELLDDSKVISVPSDFLPPGQLKYTFGGGKKQLDEQYMADGNMTLGITNWFTNSISFQKVFDKEDYDILSHSTFRVGGNLTFNADYSPDKLISGGIGLWSDSYGTYNCAYTVYNGYSGLNNRGGNNAIDFDFSLPRIGALPLNVMVRSSRVQRENDINYLINSDFRFYISVLDLGVKYNGSFSLSETNDYIRHNISPHLTYSMYNTSKFLSFLDNTRATLSCNYENSIKKITYFDLALEQSIFKMMYLRANYRKDLITGTSSLNLSLRTELSPFRTNSGANYSSNSSGNYSNSINGLIGFNSTTNNFHFDNKQSYGSISSGAANFRFFLDDNSNDVYDEGEFIVPGVSVSVSVGTSKIDPKGSTIVYNLPPGQRINTTVNLESIKNPLWVPKYQEFAFIAEPNSYKPIDVPCYSMGQIEGKVFKVDSTGSKGQSGVRIHLINKEDGSDIAFNVFSDGSFYKMDVIPGSYTVQIDSLQLHILDVVSSPPSLDIRVLNADYIDGLEFQLAPGEQIGVYDELAKKGDTGNNTDFITNLSHNYFPYTNKQEYMPSKRMVAYLKGILEMFEGKPEADILVAAYIKQSGDRDADTELIAKRVDVVANYLIEKGVPKENIITKSEIVDKQFSNMEISDEELSNGIINIQIIE